MDGRIKGRKVDGQETDWEKEVHMRLKIQGLSLISGLRRFLKKNLL